MPSPSGYKRDYKEEEKTAKQRGETDAGSASGDATRHRARREMMKLGAVKKGEDVDHIKPLSEGGAGTERSNLRARSVHANRSYPRTAKGAIKKP